MSADVALDTVAESVPAIVVVMPDLPMVTLDAFVVPMLTFAPPEPGVPLFPVSTFTVPAVDDAASPDERRTAPEAEPLVSADSSENAVVPVPPVTDVIPVSARFADERFSATEVVPILSEEFPKTPVGIVPFRLPAVRVDADVRYVEVSTDITPAVDLSKPVEPENPDSVIFGEASVSVPPEFVPTLIAVVAAVARLRVVVVPVSILNVVSLDVRSPPLIATSPRIVALPDVRFIENGVVSKVPSLAVSPKIKKLPAFVPIMASA